MLPGIRRKESPSQGLSQAIQADAFMFACVMSRVYILHKETAVLCDQGICLERGQAEYRCLHLFSPRT